MNPQTEPAREQSVTELHIQPEQHQAQQQTMTGSLGTDPDFDELVWDIEYGRP